MFKQHLSLTQLERERWPDMQQTSFFKFMKHILVDKYLSKKMEGTDSKPCRKISTSFPLMEVWVLLLGWLCLLAYM